METWKDVVQNDDINLSPSEEMLKVWLRPSPPPPLARLMLKSRGVMIGDRAGLHDWKRATGRLPPHLLPSLHSAAEIRLPLQEAQEVDAGRDHPIHRVFIISP